MTSAMALCHGKLLAQQKDLGGQRQAISVWSGQSKEKALNSPSSSVANVVSTSFESFVINNNNSRIYIAQN